MRQIEIILQVAIVAALACAWHRLSAQSSPAPPAIPAKEAISTSANPFDNNPATILQLASGQNGMDFHASVPWHIKLSYDQFDEDGDNVHSGTFEEFYVAPKRYKQILTGDVLNQVNIATESGLYRSGDLDWVGAVELQVQNEVELPLYRSGLNRDKSRPESTVWQVGKASLPCVILRRTDMTISDNGLPKFCFDPNSVRLRYTRGKGWDETVYNNPVVFQGRTLARDTTVTQAGKPYLKIHVEIFEPLTQVDESLFAPPTGSSLIGGRIKLGSAILMDEYLISRGALAGSGEQGKVDLRFVVGKDGRVIESQVLDGPEKLRKTALKSLGEYRFKPFMVLDQPVEVESTTFFQYN
jgi:hypothetical protein